VGGKKKWGEEKNYQLAARLPVRTVSRTSLLPQVPFRRPGGNGQVPAHNHRWRPNVRSRAFHVPSHDRATWEPGTSPGIAAPTPRTELSTFRPRSAYAGAVPRQAKPRNFLRRPPRKISAGLITRAHEPVAPGPTRRPCSAMMRASLVTASPPARPRFCSVRDLGGELRRLNSRHPLLLCGGAVQKLAHSPDPTRSFPTARARSNVFVYGRPRP